jgi:hypothetical protein
MDRYTALIRYYKHRYRPRIDAEDHWFAAQPTLADAISNAGLARDWRGKRLPHANRFSPHLLKKSASALLHAEDSIAGCRSFDQLHQIVNASLKTIWDKPELFSYDTALRIGAKLGLRPEKVYLHRGTRIGAKKLGLNTKRPTLDVADLRSPLRCLEPREAEDFLCIFKHKF